jgi:hypothetical protein
MNFKEKIPTQKSFPLKGNEKNLDDSEYGRLERKNIVKTAEREVNQ